MSLEDLVKYAPNMSYQLYFASDKANLEILAHVGIYILKFFFCRLTNEVLMN